MVKVQALAALIIGVALGYAFVSIWGGRQLAAVRPAVPEAVDMPAMPTTQASKQAPESFTIVEPEPELTQQVKQFNISENMASAAGTGSAEDVQKKFVADVLRLWPTFDSFFREQLAEIQAFFDREAAGSSESDSNRYDDGPQTPGILPGEMRMAIPIWTRRAAQPWTFPNDICNIVRLKVFALKLHELGFDCAVGKTGMGTPFGGMGSGTPFGGMGTPFGGMRSGIMHLHVSFKLNRRHGNREPLEVK